MSPKGLAVGQAGEPWVSQQKTVIIDLEETEKSRLGEMSELASAEGSGVLSVKNVSAQNRIWNVRLHLSDSRAGTNIQDQTLAAGEIDAGAKWTTSYGITVGSPVLKLTEIYDTCRTVTAEKAHWAYVRGKENPIRITLHVKNETDGQIDNVILNKAIPPELSMVKIESVKSGTAKFDEGTRQVVWKDFVIYPREESTLVLMAVGRVDDVAQKSAGEAVISYRAEGQQRSSLNPDMTALTEFLSGIETSETEPNHWDCTLECSNESDLMVRLDRAQVFLAPEKGGEKQKMIDETPHIEMKPTQSWSSAFDVDSKSPPKCTHDVVYTPMRVIKKRVLGTISKTPQTIPVLSIDYKKAFDPPEVNSFDKTPVEVTIEITNNGTAKIDDIQIEDNLPDDMMPPKKEHITVWVRGKEYKGGYTVTLSPDDQDPEKPHKLKFRITGMKDTVGELQPGESVKVNYAVMAWRSRPEKEYLSPIHCSANTYPAGIPAESASAPDGHKLGIVYRKRRIGAKKAINKGAKTGEYVIVLVVENKGEVTVENVKVVDWAPATFKFVSTDPLEEEPKIVVGRDGTQMTWTWARMNPGDKKSLRVTVRGEGEYERREPEVTSD